MVKDLKLGGDADMTLTSADSNVTTDFVLKAENTGTWCTDMTAECYNQSLMIKTGVPNGYLYNWYAATAGTGKYETSTGNATGDICPKGWSLPTGGTGGQFSALSVAYGGPANNQADQQAAISNLMSNPIPALNYTGNYSNNGFYGRDKTMFYWSRTSVEGSHASVFDFYLINDSASHTISPRDSSGKSNGFAA